VNSPTHTLLALALLSKRGNTHRNWAVLMGSFIPDIVIYIWAPYQKFVNGVSGREMWGQLYFEAPMQSMIAVFNSIPIYALLAVIGYFTIARNWGLALFFFAAAALIHIATDMPVHGHDAYRHFWPFSDWRFESPFSYYEQDLHGRWVSLIESVIALISIIVLWRRFPKIWVRIILAFFGGLYLLMQVYMHLVSLPAPA